MSSPNLKSIPNLIFLNSMLKSISYCCAVSLHHPRKVLDQPLHPSILHWKGSRQTFHILIQGERARKSFWVGSLLFPTQVASPFLSKSEQLETLPAQVASKRTATAACDVHLMDMYVDKHTGKHMTGNSVRSLLLTLPFVLQDLTAPKLCDWANPWTRIF